MPAEPQSNPGRSAEQIEEDKPTLIGQLKLLDREYGEDFAQDVAAPIARAIQQMRKVFGATVRELELKVDHARDRADDLENAASEGIAANERLATIEEDLEDMQRGLLTQDEFHERHSPRRVP